MNCQEKPISVSLSPNTQKDDVLLALNMIFKPREWQEGRTIKELEESFKKYLGIKFAYSFNSGRSSLEAILRALEIKSGDDVLVQAFTCNAAINPILKVGAKPVFVDIDSTLNLSVEDLKKKITPQTKAVMVQHTFGWPADLAEIKNFCQQNKLYLIEDCAHALGAEYGSREERGNHPALSEEKAGSSTFQPRYASGKVGTFGDASFFSFGRDKVISSVYGGMAVTNNPDIAKKIGEFYASISYPSSGWTLQQLLHPVLMNYLVLPAYNCLKIGKAFLSFFINTGILSKAVTRNEGRGVLPGYFPKRLPNALAVLAQNQFKKLEEFNSHRQKIAKIYEEKLGFGKFALPFSASNILNKTPIFMKYPILAANPQCLLKKFKENNIYLNDGWSGSPIVPPSTCLGIFGYEKGSCPKAEQAAQRIINLPTHINITTGQAESITKILIDS
ncbi:MAG: aminotransferase class V-fold PLP-dependent enzyme [Candidatus Paceibacterota bacterium]|jgi:dTDP-4-amino-4,6-dideoxygalactose transaminase